MRMLRYFGFVWLVMGLGACLEPIALELPENEAKLVVVSNFSHNNPFRVVVTQSRSFNSGQRTQYVNNATVKLLSEGDLIETLTYFPSYGTDSFPSYGSVDNLAEIGKLYEILVEAPGFEPVSSIGFIPAPSSMNSSTTGNSGGVGGEQRNSFWVTVNISDPKFIDNYYHLNIYQVTEEEVVNSDGQDRVRKYYGPLVMESPDDDLPLVPYIDNRGVLIRDDSFDGQEQAFSFRTFLETIPASGKLGDFVIELRTVSREYYLYYLTLKRQNDKGTNNPLSEPVVEYSNIENGLGIFAGFSISLDTVAIR